MQVAYGDLCPRSQVYIKRIMPDLQEDGTNDLYLKEEEDEPEICTMSVLP